MAENPPNSSSNEVDEHVMAEKECGVDVECQNDWFEIKGVDDVGGIDFTKITCDSMKHFKFADNEVAYSFYNAYGLVKGFSIRRSKLAKNCEGKVVRQYFLCSSEGFRHRSYLELENRKRNPKSVTRFGCVAKMHIQLDDTTGWWHVIHFNDEHNHPLFGGRYGVLMRSHNSMSEADVSQMNFMRMVGISMPHIYSSMASQAGGYEKLGFNKRNMYNQVHKQRYTNEVSSSNAIKYLGEMAASEPEMFWKNTVCSDGTIDKPFWCDGISRYDYQVFGDVLAFDATYRRNKYNCPLVVFSGVNHHNNTIVFSSAIITDESDDTYTWLLETFLEAMNQKAPKAVITDGDNAMRKAIKKVFPGAHHRLCAWHLIRNAGKRVDNPQFTHLFRKCMLTDYETGRFQRMWALCMQQIDSEAGLNWASDIINIKEMWAVAFMRGKFFAGFRTTSRCEGMHAQLGKFICYRNDLTELLQHFQRALSAMRNAELEADFNSAYGEPVIQTHMYSLERHAAKVFTREIFEMFRPYIMDAVWMKVIGWKDTPSYKIYTVTRYQREHRKWHVCYSDNDGEVVLKCSCERMETYGIPCAHQVSVLFFLGIGELPKCVVMDRWTKAAKDKFDLSTVQGPWIGEALKYCRYAGLLEWAKRLCKAASATVEDYTIKRDMLRKEALELESKLGGGKEDGGHSTTNLEEIVRDPQTVRSKGTVNNLSPHAGKRKRVLCCGICRLEGHTRKSCPMAAQVDNFKKARCVSRAHSDHMERDEFDDTFRNNDEFALTERDGGVNEE